VVVEFNMQSRRTYGVMDHGFISVYFDVYSYCHVHVGEWPRGERTLLIIRKTYKK
jgi:hypothetical protein